MSPPRQMRNVLHGSSSSNNHKKDLTHLQALLQVLPKDADEQLIGFFCSKFPSFNQSTNQGQPGTKPSFLAKQWVRIVTNLAAHQDLSKIASDALQIIGASHQVLCALVFVGVALERIVAVKPNEEKCLKLLAMMGTTVISLRDMRQYFHHSNKVVLKNALQIVLENCVFCCGYLNGPWIFKICRAKSVEGQIVEAQQRLGTILASVNCAGMVELQRLLEELQRSLKEIQQRNNYYVVPMDNILETESPVGLQEAIEEVCKLLRLKQKRMQSVAVIISGLGGMGKTTLASASIKRLTPSINDFKFSRVVFDNHMESGRLSGIQQQLVNNLTGTEPKFGNTADGRAKLKEVLESTSSFIFIDNVNFSNDVEEFLPKSLKLKQGVILRILITSRDTDVTLKVRKICEVEKYSMQPLRDKYAKELLYKTIMDSADGTGQEQFPGEMQKLKEVKKLCCGIPILFHQIGTHLAADRSLECYNQIIKELTDGNFSCLKSILDDLLLVFTKLNVDLQNAFLYICSSLDQASFLDTRKAVTWKIVGLTIGEHALKSLWEKGLVQKSKGRVRKSMSLVWEDGEEVMVHDIWKTMMSDKIKKYSIYNISDKTAIKGNKKYAAYRSNKEVDCEGLDSVKDSLRSLHIRHCLYVTTRNRCEATLVKLQMLMVVASPLPVTSLKGFTDLSNLSLKDCHGLTKLPSGICLLRCLTILSISDCSDLVSFPRDLSSLTSLKMLFISDCPNLKSSLDRMNMPQHLKILVIMGCYKMGFPKDIANLTFLEDCYLSKLRKDDDGVVCFKIPSSPFLKTLSLESNSLRTLTGDFDKLQNLETLHLQSNYLTNLPVQLCQHARNLKLLDLRNCSQLKSLPKEISLLTSLKELRCVNIKVKALPQDFANLRRLAQLDLCKCGSLPEDSMDIILQLKNLQELNITGSDALIRRWRHLQTRGGIPQSKKIQVKT